MPELPEVETVRRGLEPAMSGARFTQVEQRRAGLRFPFPENFAERLAGRRILSIGRRAKYLLVELDLDETLVMHLGMSGRFIVQAGDGGAREPGVYHDEITRHIQHDHVVMHLDNGTTVTYNDVRRFGFMDLLPNAGLAASAHFRQMGIEPLGNELSGDLLARLFHGRKTPLKAALLDQRLVAGLGNIYVCEALFRAGLHPAAAAGAMSDPDGRPAPAAHRLAAIIRDVLAEAVAAGGSTLSDFAHTDGSLGYFQHRFKVYDREGAPCVTPACSSRVARFVQGGRSTFFCPTCQKNGQTAD